MSHRLEKINELIKHELGKILLREEEFGHGVLLTILLVETTKDLKESTVTISIYPNNKRDTAFKHLTSHIYQIQQFLNKKIQTYIVPKICFVLDTSEAESEKIDKIINDLKED